LPVVVGVGWEVVVLVGSSVVPPMMLTQYHVFPGHKLAIPWPNNVENQGNETGTQTGTRYGRKSKGERGRAYV
jgi:hypothetical protein